MECCPGEPGGYSKENLTDDDVGHGGEEVEEKRRWWPKEEKKRVRTRGRLWEQNWQRCMKRRGDATQAAVAAAKEEARGRREEEARFS
ncbi:uncharacterized protein DS421_5g166730 [Arachis hypogaea]|nr:uncharacterized protein DS421_5g166730 [Arachis hypogaea]